MSWLYIAGAAAGGLILGLLLGRKARETAFETGYRQGFKFGRLVGRDDMEEHFLWWQAGHEAQVTPIEEEWHEVEDR